MPGEIPTPEQEQVKPTLKEAIVQTREAKVSALIENDAKIAREKAEARAAKRAERQEARAARIEKFNEAKDKTKDKVKTFRAWDRKMTLTLGGEIASVPKTIELTTKAGVEAVSDGMERADAWIVQKETAMNESIDNSIDAAKGWVSDRVSDVLELKDNTLDYLSFTYNATKTLASEKIQREKDKVIKGWKKTRALPFEVSANIQERRSARMQRKLERVAKRFTENYSKSQEIMLKHRSTAAEIKGTKVELASALA